MIPKIVHYTWFSKEPMPTQVVECIDSWKKFLPDFELHKWDMEAIRDIDSPFLTEALNAGKWAYAADFVRVYAVYNMGGVYLDTDVMLYQSLNKYLNYSAFIGKESSIHFVGRLSSQYLSSHCFGAVKGHPFIKTCLDYYMGRHFEMSKDQTLPNSLRYNMVLMPYVQAEIAKSYGYKSNPYEQEIQHCKEGLTIFPSNAFDPIESTSNSTCKHLALGSWRDERSDEINYSLKYKLEWRFIVFLQRLVSPLHYLIIKIW